MRSDILPHTHCPVCLSFVFLFAIATIDMSHEHKTENDLNLSVVYYIEKTVPDLCVILWKMAIIHIILDADRTEN
jgi:hypothetical protein